MDHFGIDRHRTRYLQFSENRFNRVFLEVFPFTECKGAVRDRSGAYFIGPDGKPCFEGRYLRAYPFRDGIAAVCDELGMFHIDADGRPLYTRRYAWVSDYHESLCAVRYRNGDWSYIDTAGNAWESRYRYCSDFREGYAAVFDDSGFYHVDLRGKASYGHRFDFCRKFDRGHAPVMKNGVWHMIDTNGERVTGDFDRINEGRNGLFTAVKGGDFGYIAADGSFVRMFGLSNPDDPTQLPGWVSDLKKYDWDSCVVFARHSERITHFLCNDNSISDSDITREGQRFARKIGNSLVCFGNMNIHARCSSSQRCVTTANCILGGMGARSDVGQCPEIGPRGTAYFTEGYSFESESDIPTTVLCMDHLIGRKFDGWYSNEEIRDRVLRMVTGFLEDGSLTFCITHDVYIIPMIAYITGRFPRDQWLDYCDGLLFLKKDGRCFAVHDGKQYPCSIGKQITIDTSESPSDLTVDIRTDRNDRSWDWQVADRIAWVGEENDIAVTACDRNGRFFFGRNDGHLLTSRMFSFAGEFRDQTAPVYIRGKGASYITDFGDILHNRWFMECKEFGEGQSPVKDGRGWHYADVEGNIVSAESFDFCDPVFHGESLVSAGGKFFIRSRDGRLSQL